MKERLRDYLKRLESQGFLRKEKIGIDQVKALLVSALKNVAASEKNLSIDEEACYLLAYTAMSKIARAFVYLHGYRPSGGQQHKTTIDVAGVLLGKDFRDLFDIFEKMRKKRNQFLYEPMLPPSFTEAENALKTAKKFYESARKFLDETHPQLKLFNDK